jgi:hypothetical protein
VEARVERIWSPRVGERETLADEAEHETGVAEVGEANRWLIGDDEEVIVLPGHGEETAIGDAAKRFDGWVSVGPAREIG